MTDRELKVHMRQALNASMPPLPDDPDLTEKVLEAHAKNQRTWQGRVFGLRMVAALAIAVLIVCGGLLAHSSFDIEEWIEHDEYGEWHHFEATNINTPTIGTAEAAVPFDEELHLVTTDWDEHVAALGWTPRVPAWLPQGWELYHYEVCDIESYCSSALVYRNPDQRYVLFIDQTVYRDLWALEVGVHQDEEGDYIQLENGVSVYIAPYDDGYTSYWIDGVTAFTVSVPGIQEDALHIIRSMYGLD